MFKGFYTAMSGMTAQQRKTEILTNNMANASTPGYKSDQSTIRSFPDMLMSAQSASFLTDGSAGCCTGRIAQAFHC